MNSKQLRERGGWAAAHHGRVVDVGRATGQSQATASRARSGRGIEAQALMHVQQLAAGIGTSPGVWVESMRAEARRTAMEHKDTGWLIRRFHGIRDEQLLNAITAAIVASRGTEREDERRAWVIVSSLATDLVAIDGELERRGVEPREFTAHGTKPVKKAA